MKIYAQICESKQLWDNKKNYMISMDNVGEVIKVQGVIQGV